MHGCVIGGRARERENMDTRAYNVVSRVCVGGCGETCGRGCKVGVCGLYVIVRWMEREGRSGREDRRNVQRGWEIWEKD